MTSRPEKVTKGRRFDLRIDDEFDSAIEDIRVQMRPVPSRSEVVRMAVMQMRDRVVPAATRRKN